MYRNIFDRLTGLIFKPKETWREIPQGEDEHEAFLCRFVYPVLGLVALAAFVGVFFNRKEFDLVIALKSSIKECVSYGGGFFLGAYLLNEIWGAIFKRQKDIKLCLFFVGYSSSVMYVLSIIMSLLPEVFFLRVLTVYTVYVIWEGAIPFMHVDEGEQMKFTVLASLIVMLSPAIIWLALFLLMPGMRF
ncbi:MAG: YIP1 family protein [Tannerella sp.]|jgi:hypothetical protein|nr:YIP1 family protein [Tannerella sp.]